MNEWNEWMGHVINCSSKGFAEFCSFMGSIFHFRGIMGLSLLLFSTSLWICVAEIKSTMNSGNAYCLLAYNFLSSAFLTKNLRSRKTEV